MWCSYPISEYIAEGNGIDMLEDTCIHMINSPLFTIVKMWNQHRWPWMNWKMKKWYIDIYKIEYNLSIRILFSCSQQKELNWRSLC